MNLQSIREEKIISILIMKYDYIRSRFIILYYIQNIENIQSFILMYYVNKRENILGIINIISNYNSFLKLCITQKIIFITYARTYFKNICEFFNFINM